jgi:hypothetical protein
MITLLTLVPWVLTVIALIVIIAVMNRQGDFEEDHDDHDDFFDQAKEVVRVAVYEDKAYWVYDNVFYESEVTREPDFETARPIDTMDMAPNQLKELLSILDELEEHKNERD